MNFEEYNILGTIINDSFGQSTEEHAGAFKIVAKIQKENRLKVTCMLVANLLNRSEMRAEANKAQDQLNKACNLFVKDMKAKFKSKAGRALKLKQAGSDMSVELMSMSPHSRKGTSLIRCTYEFEIT